MTSGSSATSRHAQLVRSEGGDATFKQFVDDKLDALAGLRPRLMEDAAKLPGSRILDGQFTAVQQAVGTARNNTAGRGLPARICRGGEEIRAGRAADRAPQGGRPPVGCGCGLGRDEEERAAWPRNSAFLTIAEAARLIERKQLSPGRADDRLDPPGGGARSAAQRLFDADRRAGARSGPRTPSGKLRAGIIAGRCTASRSG